MPMRIASMLATALLAAAVGDGLPEAELGEPRGAPQYTASGELRRPEGFRTWVFVGASLGLSYREGERAVGMDEFHHVYLRPEAYDAYRRTGRFPDKTVLVLEGYEAARKAAPARQGLFEGRRLALEAAVKDVERFPEEWAYFSFGDGSTETAAAFPKSRCFECHRQHAAADNVFIQFYPVLRDAAH